MADHTVLEKTRAVVSKVAPEELRVLSAQGFPEIDAESSLRGPMGIGFEMAFVLVSPLIYAFFDSLAKEGGKLFAESVRDALVTEDFEELTEEGIVAFFESRGVDQKKANEIAAEVLGQLSA